MPTTYFLINAKYVIPFSREGSKNANAFSLKSAKQKWFITFFTGNHNNFNFCFHIGVLQQIAGTFNNIRGFQNRMPKYFAEKFTTNLEPFSPHPLAFSCMENGTMAYEIRALNEFYEYFYYF